MPEAGFFALLIVLPVVGGLVRRWSMAVGPAIAWPAFYVGLDRGWWGHGTGDFWQFAAVVMTAAGVTSTATVIAIARRVRPRD